MVRIEYGQIKRPSGLGCLALVCRVNPTGATRPWRSMIGKDCRRGEGRERSSNCHPCVGRDPGNMIPSPPLVLSRLRRSRIEGRRGGRGPAPDRWGSERVRPPGRPTTIPTCAARRLGQLIRSGQGRSFVGSTIPASNDPELRPLFRPSIQSTLRSDHSGRTGEHREIRYLAEYSHRAERRRSWGAVSWGEIARFPAGGEPPPFGT